MSPANHTWKGCVTRQLAAFESPDGNDRTERVCTTCGAVAITVHGARGVPWIEWRAADGVRLAGRPGCVVRQEKKAA